MLGQISGNKFLATRPGDEIWFNLRPIYSIPAILGSKAAPGVDKDNLIQAVEEDLSDDQKMAIAQYLDQLKMNILASIKKDRRGKVVMPDKIDVPALILKGGLIETAPTISTSSSSTSTSTSHMDDLEARFEALAKRNEQMVMNSLQ